VAILTDSSSGRDGQRWACGVIFVHLNRPGYDLHRARSPQPAVPQCGVVVARVSSTMHTATVRDVLVSVVTAVVRDVFRSGGANRSTASRDVWAMGGVGGIITVTGETETR
jgi:hypothetical protein